MTDLDKLEAALDIALSFARDAARGGSDFDAGRYDGLKQALEILGDVKEKRLG